MKTGPLAGDGYYLGCVVRVVCGILLLLTMYHLNVEMVKVTSTTIWLPRKQRTLSYIHYKSAS